MDNIVAPLRTRPVSPILCQLVSECATRGARGGLAASFPFVEREAALTSTGKAGIARVDTNGLVAAVFDHPDSRTGEPDQPPGPKGNGSEL